MITKDMIKRGFENGIISIEEEYGGCLGICCKIGHMAFYFTEDSNLTKYEYWKAYTLDMTINMILNVLKDSKSAKENGINDPELSYYESVLKRSEAEHIHKKPTTEEIQIWEVNGIDDLKGTCFAYCSTKEKAERAMRILEENGFEDMLVVEQSNLKLDQLVIDNKTVLL